MVGWVQANRTIQFSRALFFKIKQVEEIELGLKFDFQVKLEIKTGAVAQLVER
jgi:hypothetical protein